MIYALGEREVKLLGQDWFIADNATVIGSVVLHNNVSVWFNAVLRGDNDTITIAQNTNIQDSSVLHTDPGFPITIEHGVTVGHMVMLHGCHIGANSLIGMKAVILNNARIGENCMIGANTLISEGKVIPDGSLVVGSPGRVIRQVSAADIRYMQTTAQHYIENFQLFKRELRPQEV